jgi:plastocyanin
MLAVALAVPSPAAAADRVVTVSDFQYSPADPTLTLGSRVEFTFADPGHSATSDQGFFDTGVRADGFKRVWFPASGTYPFHCVNHASMTGSVRVPPRATAATDGGWLVRWADVEAPSTLSYDVQKRRPGGTRWRDWRTDTTDATTTFDPARSGTWRIRARSTSSAEGVGTSRWSPTLKVEVA